MEFSFTGMREKPSTGFAGADSGSLRSRVTSDRARPDFELVTVQSGARSLRSLACGETFHPVIGPMAEARALHVRGPRLLERARALAGAMVIWDVGLGAAGNAIAALEALAAEGLGAEIHSFDATLAPLEFARGEAAALGYLVPWLSAVEALLAHGAWGDPARGLRWVLHQGDFPACAPAAPRPQAVFYDPYSARVNPELWTLESFARLRAWIGDEGECILTNYTRSTAIRVTWLLAGFFVGRGAASGEKEQTSVATNRRELLDDPLEGAWLERVARSVRSAPRRAGEPAGGAISPADFARLRAHPQFAR